MTGNGNVPAIIEPWEKQPRESSKAFYAFAIYRDLGAPRSHAKVERILRESGTAGPSMVRAWSTRHDWVRRAEAYDAHLDRERQHELRDLRRKADELQRAAGGAMLVTALRRIEGDDYDATMELPEGEVPARAIHPNELNPRDAAGFAEGGAKLLRAGLGETPLDLASTVLIPGPAVQRLARDLVLTALDRIPEEEQDAFMRDAEAIFRQAFRP